MAQTSRKLFLDSSVLLAFIDRSDSNHANAAQLLQSVAQLKFSLFTGYNQIMETYAIVAREIGKAVALEFLNSTLNSNIEVLFPQKSDLASASRFLQNNKGRQITLREVLTGVMMDKRNISQIATFTYWPNLFGTQVTSLIVR